jgi:hypothetical protein
LKWLFQFTALIEANHSICFRNCARSDHNHCGAEKVTLSADFADRFVVN